MDKFYRLDNISDIEQKYISEGLNEDYYKMFKPNIFRSNFKCSFDESEFIQKLKSKFGNVFSTWIYNPPNTLYDWHVDALYRNCTINIPIKIPDKAGTYYRDIMHPESPTKYYNLFKVPYTLYKPTLLNTNLEHCVVNPTDETRIVLNITFEKNVTYDKVLAEVAQW